MSRVIATIALLFTLMLIPFAIASNTASADPHGGDGESGSPSPDAAPVSCKANPTGHRVDIECKAAGVVVLKLSVPIPDDTITLPPVTLPPVKVTATVTAPPRPPVTIQATKTVHVPGPTRTQFLGGSTATVTATPRASSTQGVPLPGITRATATVTKTVTVKSLPSGQPKPSHDTLGPDHSIIPDIPIIDFSGSGPVQKATLGFVAIITLIALVLLSMYAGYYLGFKDSNRNEAKFLDALLKKKD